MTNPVLEAIGTRRMTRALTDEPIARSELEEVLKAARWAPSAGNRRLHRFIAIQDPLTLKLLRMVSPGMFQRPAAVVVICIDRAKAESFGMRPNAKGLFVDVGTSAQTMLLAAHSLGLGAGVVTSFSQFGGERDPERTRGPQSGDVRMPRPRGTDATTRHAERGAGNMAELDAVGALSEVTTLRQRVRRW